MIESALTLALVVLASTPAQAGAERVSAFGAFAFANGPGTDLLAPPGLESPPRVRVAFCPDGLEVSVAFVARQAANAADTGRQIAGNFANLAGTLFHITRGATHADATCFLATDALTSGSTPLVVRPPTPEGGCDPETQGQYAAARRRSIVHCWRIAHLPPDAHVVLVEFERAGRDALASLVLASPQGPIFADFPAEYRGPGQDLWRADDGGLLSPDGFEVLLVLRRASGYALAVNWAAPEGASLLLLTSRDGPTFVEDIRDYRYWAPK